MELWLAILLIVVAFGGAFAVGTVFGIKRRNP